VCSQRVQSGSDPHTLDALARAEQRQLLALRYSL
jgi:hypothetical protein